MNDEWLWIKLITTLFQPNEDASPARLFETEDALRDLISKLAEREISTAIARREFRRLDQKNVGRVAISDLKTIVRRFGIQYSSEEIYKLATILDQNCTGIDWSILHPMALESNCLNLNDQSKQRIYTLYWNSSNNGIKRKIEKTKSVK